MTSLSVKIHSQDRDKPSNGKTFRVKTNNYSVRYHQHIYDWLPGYLELTAEYSEDYGTGGRGGEPKRVERVATLWADESVLDEMLRAQDVPEWVIRMVRRRRKHKR